MLLLDIEDPDVETKEVVYNIKNPCSGNEYRITSWIDADHFLLQKGSSVIPSTSKTIDECIRIIRKKEGM